MTIFIPSYLVMYLWKEACRQEGKDHFTQLLHLPSLSQRQDDCEHDTARVSIIHCKPQYIYNTSYI